MTAEELASVTLEHLRAIRATQADHGDELAAIRMELSAMGQQQWAMDVKARRDAMWAPFRAMLAELARLAPDTLSQFLSMQGETRELLREMCGGVLSKEQWDSFVEYQRRLKKEGLMRGAARTSLGLSEYKFKKLSAGFEIEPDGKLWLASISDWVAAYFPETIERLKQKQPARAD